jgi:cytochrome c-type biogenesis protein CcmF
VPVGLTLIALFVIVITGTTEPIALLGYTFVILAGFVAVYEIFRGASARSRSKGENLLHATLALFTRNRRRYGGYIVHLGVTIIGIGVIGSTIFQVETQRVMTEGETLQVEDYTVRYNGITFGLADDGRQVARADVTVFRNGQELTTLYPRMDHFGSGADAMTMTVAGQHSTFENDFYVLLNSYDTTNSPNTVRLWIYINPLVNLVWWGAFILMAGTFISAWPNEPLSVNVRQRVKAGASVRGAAA